MQRDVARETRDPVPAAGHIADSSGERDHFLADPFRFEEPPTLEEDLAEPVPGIERQARQDTLARLRPGMPDTVLGLREVGEEQECDTGTHGAGEMRFLVEPAHRSRPVFGGREHCLGVVHLHRRLVLDPKGVDEGLAGATAERFDAPRIGREPPSAASGVLGDFPSFGRALLEPQADRSILNVELEREDVVLATAIPRALQPVPRLRGAPQFVRRP